MECTIRKGFLYLGLALLLIPHGVSGQGRFTKVQYDDAFSLGSQPLEEAHTQYFQLLSTPNRDDPNGEMLRYWGPKLDGFFEKVCNNLQLSEDEVYKYLLYPKYFMDLEKLVLKKKLPRALFNSILDQTQDLTINHLKPAHSALVYVSQSSQSPPEVPTFNSSPRLRRWENRHVETIGDSIFIWLPDPAQRQYQRCVLYRTLYDFMATPIGPPLPEGVLGFVPRHDPNLPIVIYSSLGEQRLRRTAQHEIAHTVVEKIAKFLRKTAVTRNQNTPKDSVAADWRPSRGGFSAITHENYAEYLAFPHGKMEPTLRAALIEMVSENRLAGLGAISVGARTIASSYIEGPARLIFLAETFGREIPKRLLVDYYSNSTGFLDQLEHHTGYRLTALEQLYRRWLRKQLWSEYLASDIPDTLGRVVANGLSGVKRDGALMVQRFRKGRQEVVVIKPQQNGKSRTYTVVRDLDGTERLPIFSSSDYRNNTVVTSVRERNKEYLLVWTHETGQRKYLMPELGSLREIRDPRLSPSGNAVVFRAVESSGRNAIGYFNLQTHLAKRLTAFQWPEVSHATFAADDSLVLFVSTATQDHTADIFLADLTRNTHQNLTRTPGISELEPILVNGHLVCLSDESGVPLPIEFHADGSTRKLLHPPFPVSRLQNGDSTLVMVATSLRHRSQPAGRAIWGFPLKKLGLETTTDFRPNSEIHLALHNAPTAVDRSRLGSAPTNSSAWDPILLSTEEPEYEENMAATMKVVPYEQKWRYMPLGLSLGNSNIRTTGVSFFGVDTEFHDQSVTVAVGQSGDFDRFGMLQYRNQTSRTHWQAAFFHRSTLRTRFGTRITDPLTVSHNEVDTGFLLGAQYYQSMITRFGGSLALTQRSEESGQIETRLEEEIEPSVEAPMLGLQLPGLDPRSWKLSWAGIEDLSILTDDSHAALSQLNQSARELSADVERTFVPSREFARGNITLGSFLSRDTRVWADARGPDSGALLVLSLSAGMNLPGSRTFLSTTQEDSLQESVGSSIDRLSASWLFLTHRRLQFVDFAFRTRGFLNGGNQALLYGLGNLYTVSGFSSGFIRSERVAYMNLEARTELWNYSRIRLPIHSFLFPAGDGFAFVDAGIASGSSSIYSYGVGLRLRYGFLGWEWRHQLRDGLRNQNGISFNW